MPINSDVIPDLPDAHGAAGFLLKLMSALAAARVLLNQDPWCQAYTRAFREGRLEP